MKMIIKAARMNKKPRIRIAVGYLEELAVLIKKKPRIRRTPIAAIYTELISALRQKIKNDVGIDYQGKACQDQQYSKYYNYKPHNDLTM